jgi:NitT/TauT family transport system substrate-binding protein
MTSYRLYGRARGRIDKSRALLAVCLAAVLLAAGGCSAGDGGRATGKPVDKVTYLTAFGSFGRESPAYVAMQLGFFAKRHIDVQIQAGQGTSSNLQLLSAGTAQFCAADLGGVWVLQGNGKYPDVRAVAAIQQSTLNSIMTLEESGISKPKDLVGRKIGGADGAAAELLWPAYAKLTGLDPKAVTWVHMAAQQLPVALAAGRVAAIGQFVVATGTVEKAAGGRKSRALPYSDVITDLYGSGLVTTVEMIKTNADLVRRFRDALLEGLVYAVEHPQEAGQIMHKLLPAQNPAAVAGELEKMVPYVYADGTRVGVITPERVDRAIAILYASSVINRQPASDGMVDFAIAPAPAASGGGVSAYALDNRHPVSMRRHHLLCSILDPHTISRLSALPLSFRGALCLEVGTGSGSMATWLAERVGPGGHVVATDIRPLDIRAHARLQVVEQDITEGAPMGPWDLILARLVLMHLPQRVEVLRELVASLAPGGVLVVEDWDTTWEAGQVMHAPSPAAQRTWETYADALARVMVRSGVDRGWASRVQREMVQAGLTNVTAQIHCGVWPGGTAGTLLHAANVNQLRGALLGEGVSDDELREIVRLAEDRALTIRGFPLVSTVGLRP